MSLYAVLLYVHLLALLAGICFSTLAHFAMARLERAEAVSEARQWHSLAGRVSKLFPLVILTFFASGSYMVALKWNWRFGFVEAGAVAALLLLVNGIIMATRSRTLGVALQGAAEGPLSPAIRDLIHDPILQTLPWVNLALVLGIVLVMTAKPTLSASLLTLLVFIAAGFIVANRLAARRPVAHVARLVDHA